MKLGAVGIFIAVIAAVIAAALAAAALLLTRRDNAPEPEIALELPSQIARPDPLEYDGSDRGVRAGCGVRFESRAL